MFWPAASHHTSGLRDQWDLLELAGWCDDDLKTNADVLHLARRQKELNFLPGDQHRYCNTGYTLMALIVERLTGKSLRAYTDEIIFKPLVLRTGGGSGSAVKRYVLVGSMLDFVRTEGSGRIAVRQQTQQDFRGMRCPSSLYITSRGPTEPPRLQ